MMSCRERILAAVRADFLNCIANGYYTIEHKVDVYRAMTEGGKIDYNDDNDCEIEFTVKSCRLTRKVDKDGGVESKIKIVIE